MSLEFKVEILDRSSSDMLTNLSRIELYLKQKTMTLEQLIKMRVTEELKLAENQQVSSWLNNLTDQEKTLNQSIGPALLKTQLDEYINRALEGFKANDYFVIVDDHQVNDLEQEIVLHDNSRAEFFRLTALVGG